jgi:hypothetical protein
MNPEYEAREERMSRQGILGSCSLARGLLLQVNSNKNLREDAQ